MITVEDGPVRGFPEEHKRFLRGKVTWTVPPATVEGVLVSVEVAWDDVLDSAYLKLGIELTPGGDLTPAELQLPKGVSFSAAHESLWYSYWYSMRGNRARWSIVHARAGHINTQFLHGYEWDPTPPDDNFDPVSFLEALRS